MTITEVAQSKRKLSKKEQRRETAKRVAALPPEFRRHRMHCIKLKTMIKVEVGKSRGATQEINRMSLDAGGSHTLLWRSIIGAIGIQQRDKERARKNTRAMQLAYGFIRGRKYDQIEQKCFTAPPRLWRRVWAYVKKVTANDPTTMQRLAQWIDSARSRPLAERKPRLKPMMMRVPNGPPSARSVPVFAMSNPGDPPEAA